MVDDIYTDPEYIYALYRFGASEGLATEVEVQAAAAVAVNQGGDGSGRVAGGVIGGVIGGGGGGLGGGAHPPIGHGQSEQ